MTLADLLQSDANMAALAATKLAILAVMTGVLLAHAIEDLVGLFCRAVANFSRWIVTRSDRRGA